MSEKRYTEAQIREVFARAAREQQGTYEEPEPGLTLREMQEVGAESGLDPALVAAAAAGLSAPARPTPTLLGMPTEVQRARILPAPLSDEAWEESVEALRTLFGGPGTASQIGRVREWRSPPKSSWVGGLETHLTSRPLPDGRTRLHVEQTGLRANVWGVIGTAGGVAALALVPLLMWVTGNVHTGSPFAFAAVMLVAALALGGGGALWAKQTARTLEARFEAALDRIDLLARPNAPAPALEAPDLGDTAEGEGAAHATVRPAAAQLDVDVFADRSEPTDEAEPPRPRARS